MGLQSISTGLFPARAGLVAFSRKRRVSGVFGVVVSNLLVFAWYLARENSGFYLPTVQADGAELDFCAPQSRFCVPSRMKPACGTGNRGVAVSDHGASPKEFTVVAIPAALAESPAPESSCSPALKDQTTMLVTDLFVAASFSTWFSSSWGELTSYFSHLGANQWMVIAASTVFFGFLCLKGNPIR